jgi:hypothetical protein
MSADSPAARNQRIDHEREGRLERRTSRAHARTADTNGWAPILSLQTPHPVTGTQWSSLVFTSFCRAALALRI